jgi:hypothetical protein
VLSVTRVIVFTENFIGVLNLLVAMLPETQTGLKRGHRFP